jgi:alpha-glucosidase (family GH31 glycosyl hydrolase)
MFNPATQGWLREQLAAWHAAVPWDGLWLDMNEPASFCEGMMCEEDPTNSTMQHCEWWGRGSPGGSSVAGCAGQRGA